MAENTVRAMGTTLTKVKNGETDQDWIVGSLTSIGEVGAEASEIDVTTLDSPDGAKEFMAGDIEPADVELEGYIKKAEDEDTVVKMMELLKSGAIETWKITFPSKATWTLKGFIKAFKTTENTTDGLIGFNATIKQSGLPVYAKRA